MHVGLPGQLGRHPRLRGTMNLHTAHDIIAESPAHWGGTRGCGGVDQPFIGEGSSGVPLDWIGITTPLEPSTVEIRTVFHSPKGTFCSHGHGEPWSWRAMLGLMPKRHLRPRGWSTC